MVEKEYLSVADGTGKHHKIAYRVYTPLIREQDRQYPVVIWLHGSGGRGHDNARQLRGLPSWLAATDHQRARPCFIIAPQCAPEFNWTSFRHALSGTGAGSEDLILGMLQETLEHRNADSSRVYVSGFSMGSFGTWDLVSDYPDVFAAAVPIAVASSAALAPDLVRVPIWAVHGSADKACPVEGTREMIEAIKQAGGRPKYTELPGVGHGGWQPTLRDSPVILDWVFSQQRGSNSISN